MSGTVAGGKLAAKKNMANDPNFYAKIGAKGGAASGEGGFKKKTPCNCSIIQGEHTKPQCAGKLGGKKSIRKSKKVARLAPEPVAERKTYWPW